MTQRAGRAGLAWIVALGLAGPAAAQDAPGTGEGGVDPNLLRLPAQSRACRHVHYLADPEDGGQAERASWSYPVGSVLRGGASLDFDGDGTPDELGVAATVVRYPSTNPLEPDCWFTVALLVKRAGKDGSKEIYRDLWSIRFDDMGDLVAALGAVNPDDYFARFAALSGRLSHRFALVPPETELIDPDAIRWSLRSQKLDPAATESIAEELAQLENVRVFSYRATWVEDRRIAGWVPSLGRVVTLRLGE